MVSMVTGCKQIWWYFCGITQRHWKMLEIGGTICAQRNALWHAPSELDVEPDALRSLFNLGHICTQVPLVRLEYQAGVGTTTRYDACRSPWYTSVITRRFSHLSRPCRLFLTLLHSTMALYWLYYTLPWLYIALLDSTTLYHASTWLYSTWLYLTLTLLYPTGSTWLY